MPFMTSLSENIHYGTAGSVDNLQYPSLEMELTNVIKSYAARDFCIIMIMVDIQFK